MKRRNFLYGLAGATLGPAAGSLVLAQNAAGRRDGGSTRMLQDIQGNWREFLPAGFEPVSADETLELSRDAWRERLGDPLAFDVLRREATERPFTSPLNDEKRQGVFLCAGCDLPVFTSEMKFDSGTGWPSFFTTIPGAFETKRDFKLVLPRTEYHCARCGGHHGHVFKDGPAPTGQRWCNNGAALRFVAKEQT
jgi:peptide-methionine (R)-S-oxide reductase